jgi:hypothetical protein
MELWDKEPFWKLASTLISVKPSRQRRVFMTLPEVFRVQSL